jgi:hypothetical protein
VSWAAPRQAPPACGGSAVRAGGPCLVPSRGGARKWASPFLFPSFQMASVVVGAWAHLAGARPPVFGHPPKAVLRGREARPPSPPGFAACASKRPPGGYSDHPTIRTWCPSIHAFPFPAVGSIK